MKKIILTFIAVLFVPVFSLLAGNDKTIANLKEAYKGESTASARYAAFAMQAKKENLPQIALLFEAISKAEAIHASNHKTVMEKIGLKVDVTKPDFIVKSTRENLEEAIKGETYDITTMYPGFISLSKAEGFISATKSFSWSFDTEKKHVVMCSNALEALKTKKVASLPSLYWVCPKCGNTFDVAKPEKSCPFCSTSSSKYQKFGK
jgi:rubrerythrin